MQWAPEIDERVQEWRADFNRRVSNRYSPSDFLEQNKRDWEDYCQRLAGDPKAVPFMWQDVLEKLKTTPTLLDHLLTKSHAGEPTPPLCRL